MPFKKVYNFPLGFMKITPGQENALKVYKHMGWIYTVLKTLVPNSVSTIRQVGTEMINSLIRGSDRQIMEVKDINQLGS